MAHQTGRRGVAGRAGFGFILAAVILPTAAPWPARAADDALRLQIQPDVLRERWHRGETFVIPAHDAAALDQAFEEIRGPEGALELGRFILHAEAPEMAAMLFSRRSDAIHETDGDSRVRLAHDGERLFVFAEWDVSARGVYDGSEYGRWPARRGDHEGPLPFDERSALAGLEQVHGDARLFNNAEFMVISVHGGRNPRFSDRVYFVDSGGRVIEQDLGTATPGPAPGVRTTEEGGVLRMAFRILLPEILPEAGARPFPMNIGRVSGAPGEGVAFRASSFGGSFLGESLFARFELGEERSEVVAAGWSYGWTGAWMEFPRGRHTASAGLYAQEEGDVEVRHEAGDQIFEGRIRVQPGLNVVSWDWTMGEGEEAQDSRLYVDGRRIDEGTARAAPRLFLSPLQYAVAADGRLRFNADLGYTPDALSGYALEIGLEGAGTRQAWAIDAPGEACVGGDIDLRKLGAASGEYRLEAVLCGPGGEEKARASHALTLTAPEGRHGEAFDVRLVYASGQAPSGPVPVRVGVPFPAGLVEGPEDLALVDGTGNGVPFAAREAAQWMADGSLKWAHVDFDYEPGMEYRVTRRAGAGSPVSGGPKVVVREDDDGIEVDTGPLRFRVGREGFDGFRELRVEQEDGSRDETVDVREGGFLATGEGGVVYRSGVRPGTTVVEESNGRRATIAFTGRCETVEGIEAIRYVLRVTAHAGRRELEFMPTFIVTADTDLVRFRAIEMRTGLGAGARRLLHGEEEVGLGGDGVRLRQTSPGLRQVREGRRAWRDVDGAEPAVFVFEAPGMRTGWALRDFERKAPLELSHDAAGGVTVSLWPDMGAYRYRAPEEVALEDLPRLPFAHQGPYLDFRIPPAYAQVGGLGVPERTGYFPSGIMFSNGMGVSRTHEFLVTFAPAGMAPGSTRREDYLKTIHLAAEHEWMARTEAVGNLPMSPRGDRKGDGILSRTERALDRHFDWERREVDAVSAGKWSWGGAFSQYNPHQDAWSSWRLFRNTHHGGSKGYWYLFARSGDPKYFEFARRTTEHIADIGTCHFAGTEWASIITFGKHPGAQTCYKGYAPWYSGSRHDYNTYSDYFLSWYYLTGHPRARDALEIMHAYLLHGAGYPEETLPIGFGGRRDNAAWDRAGASRMESACSLYFHTGDGRLIRYLHASFREQEKRQTDYGYIPTRVGFGSWLPYYIDLTENPDALEVLRKWAYLDVEKPWFAELSATGWMPHGSEIQAYAYRRFGDPELLGVALARMDREIASRVILDPGDPLDGFFTRGNHEWNFAHQKLPSLIWAAEDAGGAARPDYIRDTLGVAGSIGSPVLSAPGRFGRVGGFASGDGWNTWAVFGEGADGADALQVIRLRFGGHGHPGRDVRYRVVDAQGEAVHEDSLPGFEWKARDVSEIFSVDVAPGGAPGPYRLQVRGESLMFGPLLPFTDCAKEVYPTDGENRFGTGPGDRAVAFAVPEEGDELSVMFLSKGMYNTRVRDAATGEEVVSLHGYRTTGGLGARVRIPVEDMERLRGRTAEVTLSLCTGRQAFLFGKDIVPYVSLGADAFFLPPDLPE